MTSCCFGLLFLYLSPMMQALCTCVTKNYPLPHCESWTPPQGGDQHLGVDSEMINHWGFLLFCDIFYLKTSENDKNVWKCCKKVMWLGYGSARTESWSKYTILATSKPVWQVENPQLTFLVVKFKSLVLNLSCYSYETGLVCFFSDVDTEGPNTASIATHQSGSSSTSSLSAR